MTLKRLPLIYSGLTLIIALAVMFVFVGVVKAQETPEDLAGKYGVNFPVTELGSCSSFSECRTFCEDPVNSVACVQFAKGKGFYQEDPLVTRKDAIVNAASRALGCTNEAECRAFCQVPANYDKCESFARQNNMVGGRVVPAQQNQILEKAKQSLGCDSPQSCATYCSSPDNQGKCSEFAKQVGLRGGEVRRGPAGCTSDETCKAFCSDPVNYNECSRFGGGSQGFRGPGGCNSEESCKNHCEANPASCRMISVDPYSGPGIIDNPQKAAEEFRKYCEADPQRCSAPQATNVFSNKDARLEFEKFCSANPESCGAKQYLGQNVVYQPSQGGYTDPAEYCRKNPDRCPNPARYQERYASTTSYDPAKACSQAPNCKWENGTCNCQGYMPSTNYIRPSGSPTYYGPTPGSTVNTGGATAEQSCKNAGGSWQGSYCQMPTGSNVNYSTHTMSRESQENGCRACGGTCNWSGDFCNCQCGSSGGSSGSTSQPAPTQPPSGSSAPPPTNDPATACAQTSGCSWNGSNCQCGSTQGVSTSRGLFGTIFDFLDLQPL